MKRILAAAALLAVSSANASEVKFGDLNYFLKQGQFNLNADVNMGRETEGDTADKTRVNGQYLDTKVAYALADNMNAFVGFSYNFDAEITPPNKQRHTANGLQTPAFGLNYRVLNQADKGFNLDVGAVAKYRLMKGDVGSSGEDGDTVSGELSDRSSTSDSVELNVRLGNKWNEANEYYLTAGLVHNTASEYDVVTTAGDVEVEVDAATDLFVGGTYQYRPVNEFMLSVGVVATQVAERTVDVAGTEGDLDSHLDMNFKFNAKYLVCETMIVKFNYEQGRLADFDSEHAADDEIDNRKKHVWGFGVDWLF